MSTRLWWIGLMVAAFVVQSALSRFLNVGNYVDLPLVVAAWTALARGERVGMVAGATSGWISEALFGLGVKGVAGLVRLVIGFALGLLGSRILVSGFWARFALLLSVTVVDTRVFEWVAPAFGLAPTIRPPDAMALRGTINAIAGLLLLGLIEKNRRQDMGRE